MNLSFADTLYFKKENTLEIILGLHRSYKSLQREIQICCELNNLTFNELIVILEIKKGFKKKIDIANKVFLKKQNLNLILKDLQVKKILKLEFVFFIDFIQFVNRFHTCFINFVQILSIFFNFHITILQKTFFSRKTKRPLRGNAHTAKYFNVFF